MDNKETYQPDLPGTVAVMSNDFARSHLVPAPEISPLEVVQTKLTTGINSIWQKRFIMMVISMIKETDEEFRECKFSLKELLKDEMWLDRKHIKEIREIVLTLMNKHVIFTTKEAISGYVIFPSIRVELDPAFTTTVEINKNLMPHFLKLKEKFCEIDLFQYMSISSKYAASLFELFASYSGCETITLPVEKIYDKLEVSKYYRDNWRYFEREVLKPAQIAMLGTTEKFTYVKEKNGRKISRLVFRFYNHKKKIS